MKKLKILIITLVLFLLSFNIFVYVQDYSEEKIKTNDGEEKIVIVPKEYDQLKQKYLDLAKLYLEEKKAHEKSLKNVDLLLKSIGELKQANLVLKEKINNILKEYSKKQILKVYTFVGVDYIFDSKYKYEFYSGYQLIFYDTVLLGFKITTPTGIGVFGGLRF